MRESWASSQGLSAAMIGAACSCRAGALLAGRLDHPLDPGQMRRQMPTVARGLAGRLRPLSAQRSLSLLLRGLKHALGQFGILERQVELVGRQLLRTLAELFALRRA